MEETPADKTAQRGRSVTGLITGIKGGKLSQNQSDPTGTLSWENTKHGPTEGQRLGVRGIGIRVRGQRVRG